MLVYENGEYIEREDAQTCFAPFAGTSYGELTAAFIRERYTLDDELAIQWQRVQKPAEFSAYFAYCEECKQRAKKY